MLKALVYMSAKNLKFFWTAPQKVVENRYRVMPKCKSLLQTDNKLLGLTLEHCG